jgi:hypothetical protein
VGTLVQARYVTPHDLGYFRQFSIVTGYAFFLQLGVFGSLQRLYPYYIGKGNRARAVAVAEVAQAWNVVVSVLVSGGFVILAAITIATGDWKAMLGWLAQAVAMAGFIYGGYLSATYRCGHDFVKLAKGSLAGSIGGILVLPLFVVWPYIAMAIRACVGSLSSLFYMHIHRPLRIGWRFSWRELFGLVKEGIPMFVAGYGVSTGWSVVETTLILKSLGKNALGLWWMSFMVLEAANKVPQAVVAVYTPRLTEEFGRTENVRACLGMCRRPVVWGSLGMLAMAAAGACVLWLLVPLIMPRYAPALPSMCVMLLYLPLLVLEMPFVLLVAMGNVLQQNLVTYMGLGVFTVLALVSLAMGWGILGVIGSSLAGRVLRLGLVYWALSRSVKKPVHVLVEPDALPSTAMSTEA